MPSSSTNRGAGVSQLDSRTPRTWSARRLVPTAHNVMFNHIQAVVPMTMNPLHVGRPGQPRKSAEPLTLGPRKGPASEEIDEGEEHGPDDHADDPAWVPEEDTQFPAYDGGEWPAIA